MVQTIINLDDADLQNFVEVFKAKRSLKSKNEAIKKIIEEFKELKQEEFYEKIMAYETALLSQRDLAKNWLSEEDEKAFSYLQ